MDSVATKLSADEVEDEVMNTLPTLSAAELLEICNLIGVTDVKEEDKVKRRVLLKLVMKCLCDATTEDDKLTEFLLVHKHLKLDGGEDVKVKETVTEGTEIAAMVKKEVVEPKKDVGSKPNKTLDGATPKKAADSVSITRTIRKDFKLSGMIGGEGETALSYSSLQFEIEKGRKLGHSDAEICTAVISKVADKELRSYFQTDVDMELDGVLKMLKSVCREQKSSAVFTQFTNDKQGRKEKAITFITRVLRLRKRVLKLAQEEGRTYDEAMLAERSFEVLFGGLRDENIRSGLRDKCRNQNSLTDTEVLALAAEVIDAEKERKLKLFGKSVESEPEDVEVDEMSLEPQVLKVHCEETPVKEKKKLNPFTEIEELRSQMKVRDDRMNAQLNEIKQLVLNQKPAEDNKVQKKKWPGKCDKCTSENKPRCYHCWKCGKHDHKKPDFPEN